MQTSPEGVSPGTSFVPSRITADAQYTDEAWVAKALQMVGGPDAAAPYYLVAIDREGMAHPLAGTLARRAIGPRVLESLETPLFWSTIRPGVFYTAEQLRDRVPAWPSETQLAGRFLKDGVIPLGALLMDEKGAVSRVEAASKAEPLGAAHGSLVDEFRDLFLSLILRHWRLTREVRGLSQFSRALVEAQQGGVLALDVQGRVTYLSPLGERTLGLSGGEAVGADCARVMRPSVDGEHPLILGLRGELEQLELYIVDGRGRDLPIFLSLSRIEGARGETLGLVCFFRDLSEERALDQDSRRRERLAVIGELAAGAAHEIRNPLTGIGNAAQVLQMRLADREGDRRMADLILRETQRLDRIITDLLEFGRPGQPRMHETHIDEIVRASLELEQPVYKRNGIRCEMRVAGMIPTIYADSEQIKQVVVNLMRNSADVMPNGGLLSLEVSVVRRRRHARRKLGRRSTDRLHVSTGGPLARFVRIRVKDTGMGISPEALPRIFDPFFTTRPQGTGLGLSVSQSIIQEHDGHISVQSVHGKGTVFEVDLPIERRQGERRS
ncbi:MAG: PAS domain S-box protein [Candidatus Eisenbacteria sp.]|nr:PAS domain S-box protein [Candidatus Eisenbacteria bacterium]